MTQRKNRQPREYATFARANPTRSGGSQNMARSIGEEAQRLASRGSWADNFAPTSSASATRSRSSSTSAEEDDRLVNYRDSDPPPVYTPSESNTSQASSTPVITRAELDPVPVAPQVLPFSNAPPPTIINTQPNIPQQPLLQTQVSNTFIDDDLFVQKHGGWCGASTWWARKQEQRRQKRTRAQRIKRLLFFTIVLAIFLWFLAPQLAYCIRSYIPKEEQPQWPISPPEELPEFNRQYRQHENSQAISGNFDLYDLLELTTHSGSISITVNIHSGAKPAVLILSTKSGSIDVRIGNNFLRKAVPDLSAMMVSESISNRTYKTTISTNSGRITGNLVHGNGGSTAIRSSSGSTEVDIDVVGVGDSDPLSYITTSSSSGSQDISVSSSGGTDKVSKIQAQHHVAGSASMDIRYPLEWVGKLHASIAGSGSLQVEGSNLQYLSKTNKQVFAKRGKGELATIEIIEQGSGSVDFSC